MPFLPANQQYQSIEGKDTHKMAKSFITSYLVAAVNYILLLLCNTFGIFICQLQTNQTLLNHFQFYKPN